ncbi:chemotaxis protein [Bacillus sp. 03113]|uniref:chemotaxis protein n=1 Tax=Bacillus sp. 03113 TaxID=2578211 RepID=UPI001143AEB4|nr:chemotaxis protein [Bacillus sp. 03113]
MIRDNGILLESGTNELEIVEFIIGSNKFGINVIKVKEIILPVPVLQIPHSHKYVKGIIELRGEILPVVNLVEAIGFAPSSQNETDKFIVTEFNQQKFVFHVQNVTQIHRISWEQIEKPSSSYQGQTGELTGIVKIENEIIMLLDFEKIITEINLDLGINKNRIKAVNKRDRSNIKVIVAEDSPLLRKLLHETLIEAGIKHIHFFENGLEVLHYLDDLSSKGRNVKEDVQLIITDIEMPQMDGHHLTLNIKKHPERSNIPVILFSSLITDDLRHKGEKVGADAQVSKPDIEKLIEMIDTYIK